MTDSKVRYARIAITLPAQDLAAADRLAAAQDRSRSWIVAEAIRRYVLETSAVQAGTGDTDHLREIREATGLGASRRAQLLRDLALTPEQRVREAEHTLRLSERHTHPLPHRILAFDRYEDFLDWKFRRDTGA